MRISPVYYEIKIETTEKETSGGGSKETTRHSKNIISKLQSPVERSFQKQITKLIEFQIAVFFCLRSKRRLIIDDNAMLVAFEHEFLDSENESVGFDIN